MAWTAQKTWTVGEVLYAADFNTYFRDGLGYLHGDAGAIELQGNITFPGSETVDGVDVSAHAGGTAKAQHTGGLGDHTHQSSGAEGGQITYAAISGRLTESQLPDSTDNYVLRAQGAGVDPAWEAVAITVTEEDFVENDNVDTNDGWDTLDAGSSVTIGAGVDKVVATAYSNNSSGNDTGARIVYDGVTKATDYNSAVYHAFVRWSGDGLGSSATLKSEHYNKSDYWGGWCAYSITYS